MSTVAAMVPGPSSGAPGIGVSRSGSQPVSGAISAAGSRPVSGAGSHAVPGAGTVAVPGRAHPFRRHGKAERGQGRGERLTAAQRLAVASITVTTLGLAAYGAAAS